MSIVTLRMGDWSHDGHGLTEVAVIEANRSIEELEAAYDRGATLTGVDLSKNIARDHQDSSFPDEDIERLERFGFVKDEFLEISWPDNARRHVIPDGFWRVWMFIAVIGDPEIVWTEVPEDRSIINIGGYGLFDS